MVFTRSENQNCTPNWNSSEAKITTSTVGTAAMPANSATSRTCNCAPASPRRRLASRIATRRAISTTSVITGSRLATSSSVTIGGDTPLAGAAPPVKHRIAGPAEHDGQRWRQRFRDADRNRTRRSPAIGATTIERQRSGRYAAAAGRSGCCVWECSRVVHATLPIAQQACAKGTQALRLCDRG